MLAVFVRGRRADACSSPRARAGFSMLEASIDPSAAPAPTSVCNSSINRDTRPLGWSFLQNRLQALFELTAELRARDQCAEVERHQPLAAQAFRHVAIDDALSQTFDDSGLADAGLTDQDRDCSWCGATAPGPCDGFPRPARSPGSSLPARATRGQIGRVFVQRVIRNPRPWRCPPCGPFEYPRSRCSATGA